MTMLQLSALSRGFDCLNQLIDEVTVTILLIFLHGYVWFVLMCPALQSCLVLLGLREIEDSYICQLKLCHEYAF